MLVRVAQLTCQSSTKLEFGYVFLTKIDLVGFGIDLQPGQSIELHLRQK